MTTNAKEGQDVHGTAATTFIMRQDEQETREREGHDRGFVALPLLQKLGINFTLLWEIIIPQKVEAEKLCRMGNTQSEPVHHRRPSCQDDV